MCFPFTCYPGLVDNLAANHTKIRSTIDTVFSILFGRCFGWKRVAKGSKNGTFSDACWGMFLDMVIFLKLMAVSNGMLTFAGSGVPKMLPKIDKNWCQKTIPSFDEFFSAKNAPTGSPKCFKNGSKIDQKWIWVALLALSWPRHRFLIDFWPIFEALWGACGSIFW